MFNFNNTKSNKVFLGSPEAEAEGTAKSSIPLVEIYEDFHDLGGQLSREKFLLVGRKGSGKSAFAEYCCLLAKEDANLFCEFIRPSTLGLEKLVQLGTENPDVTVTFEVLFKWLVYTNILKMFTQNEAVKESKQYVLLQQFLEKNSGYINIDKFEIKQLVQSHGFNVSVEKFKNFMKAKFDRKIETKSERAPFYKLIPHLEETIQKLLVSQEEIDNQNSYMIFFDDLDVGFSTKNQSSVDLLMALIRVCRQINNEIFGKHNINAKVVILLRDDIQDYLSSLFPDTAKIFSSYSAIINWYQREYNTSEDNLYLKRFINKRIDYAFKKAGYNKDESYSWNSLVSEEVGGEGKASFKYIINNTLYRPRDVLLFFKPISEGFYKLPLSKSDVVSLTVSFSIELAKEVKNELSSFYDQKEIETIFLALSEVVRREKVTYSEAKTIFDEYCKNVNSDSIIEYLLERSLLGTVNDGNYFNFRCRADVGEWRVNKNHSLIVQMGMKPYLQRY